MEPRFGASAVGWMLAPHLTKKGKARKGASLGYRELRILFGYVK